MPGLRDTARRNEVAADLLGLEQQANSAIDQLLGVKGNLLNLKADVNADDNFDAADEAEVQAVIVALAERVQSEILGG